MYADDIVLYSKLGNNVDAIQIDLNNIVHWCNGNELTMNVETTKYQIFTKGNHISLEPLINAHHLLVGKEALKQVKLYKYLGVEIDSLLSMKPHAKNVIKLGAHKLFLL